MATRKQLPPKPDPFPFLFLGHGPWAVSDYRACVEWQVVFQSAVAEKEQAPLLASVAAPLDYNVWSDGRVLTLSTGQDAGVGIWNAYSGKPLSEEQLENGDFEDVNVSAAQIKEFCTDVDQWLLKVHAEHPISVVLGPTEKEDKWHRWSVKQFPDRLLPLFEVLFKDVRSVAEVARDPSSLESAMADALLQAVKAYFSAVPAAYANTNLVLRTQTVMECAGGYSSLADYNISYLRRLFKEERPDLFQ